ncbi:MAG: sigma-70 family RNA polymerase sigma factor [Planctomycetota bacterium]
MSSEHSVLSLAAGSPTEDPPLDPTVAALLALQAPAYQVALRVVGSAELAEDVVQQVYLQLLTRRMEEPFTSVPPDDLRPWFFRVVINRAKNHRRDEQLRKQREDQSMSSSSSSFGHSIPQELIQLLRQGVRDLPEQDRLPLVLCYEQGLSQQEAASVLEVPPRTLSDRIARGLEQLRLSLQKAGYQAVPSMVLTGLKHTAPAAPASLGPLLLQAGRAGTSATASAPAAGAAASGTKATAGWLVGLFTLVALLVGWSIWQMLNSPPAPIATLPAAVPPVSVGAPPPSVASAPSSVLTTCLDTPMDATYKNAFPFEVLRDLEFRFTLHSAYPSIVKNCCVFTYQQQGTTVRKVLEHLAAEGHLTLEFHGDTVILWRAATDAELAGLHDRLRSADEQARSEAVWDLTGLGDPRIFAELAPTWADPSPVVRFYLQRGLSAQQIDVLRHRPETAAWVQPLQHLIEQSAAKEQLPLLQLMSSLANTGTVTPAATLLKSLCSAEAAAAAKADDKELHRVCRDLIDALAATHDPSAFEPLMERAQAGPFRPEAIEALGRLGDPRAVEPLLRWLDTQPDASAISEASLRALGQLADARALPRILALVGDKEVPAGMQRFARMALQHFREPAAQDLIFQRMIDPDFAISNSAYVAALLYPFPHLSDRLLTCLEAADDPHFDIAVQVLAERQDLRAVPTLLRQLFGPKGDVVLQHIGKFRDSRAIEPLHKLLKESPPEKTGPILVALAEAGDTEVPATLAKQWNLDPTLQRLAVVALNNSRDPAALKFLILNIQSASDDRAESVLSFLRSSAGSSGPAIDTAWAREVFRAETQDPRPRLRQLAVAKLASSDDERDQNAVMALLHDPDPETCSMVISEVVDRNTAWTMAQRRGPGLVPDLLAALKDSQLQVRLAAIGALANTGDPRAADTLAALLKDPAPSVCMKAAFALGDLSDPRAIEPLIEDLKDADPAVRDRAQKQLQSFDDPRAKAAVGEIEKHRHDKSASDTF